MSKTVRTILIIIFAGVFAFSAVRYFMLRKPYEEAKETYSGAVSDYTKPSQQNSNQQVFLPADGNEIRQEDRPELTQEDNEPTAVIAPIEVDFAGLTRVNTGVIGWIYCEDTVINYPVVFGVDNSYYLDHDYRGAPSGSGAIFTDASNIKGFVDSNIIMYGHHMSDMSMFATLKYWMKQEYLDEHPVMWLLTPVQDYRVELFAAYETQADSDTYTVFRGPGPLFEQYLSKAVEKSGVNAPVEIDPEARYLLLSTCAYSNALARTVLHGKLVPVDSAGGVPISG